VDSCQTETFDELFDFVYSQPWDKIISPDQVVLVEGSTYQSQLASLPAIQKIVKKAITKKLMNGTDAQWTEDKSKGIIYVSLMLHQNKAVISLNSSGDSLHRRGYRVSTGDAPIKETIAA
jgi:putative N6-adenine-specific DNA methylase